MKKFLFGSISILVLLIIAALAAPMFISVDVYKNQIKSLVENATGRTLNIEGKLSVQFFPVAGITAEKISLSNPKGFDDNKPFMSLQALTVEVSTVPLFSGEIVVKNFVLQDPVVHMQQNTDGRKNWTFAAKPKDEGKEAKSDRPQMSNPRLFPSNIALKNFEVRNGTLLMTKGCCDKTLDVKKLNLSVVLQSSASAAAIEGDVEWQGKKVALKGGLGTLETLINDQKMELKLSLSNDLMSINYSGNYDHGALIGKQTSQITSIKDLLKWLTPGGKPVDVPGKLAFKSEGELRCGANYCTLPTVDFTLDSFNAKGNLRAGFGEAKPLLDVNLTTTLLDLNQFMPVAAQKSASITLIPDAQAQASERWSDAPIDLSALNAFNANVNIKADKLVAKQFTIEKVALGARLQQGLLNAEVNNATLYKGTGKLMLRLNAGQVPPAIDSAMLFRNIDLEALLKDVSGKDSLKGYGDLELDIKTQGRSVKAMVSNLLGNTRIKVAKGYIAQLNLLDMLQNNAAAFSGASAENTEISDVTASGTISQGVLTSRDLSMMVKGIHVSGDGTVNLPAYTLNYKLTPQLQKTTQDATTGASVTKTGFAVPVIIEGSLDNPKYRPDLAAVAQQALDDPKKLKENLRNSREVLKEQIKDPKAAVKNIKGLLQGLGR